MFKRCLGAFALAGILGAAAAPAQAYDYPRRDITAIVPWGAGGATDVAMRALAPLAEDELGKKLVIQNRTGGSGAVGANFVLRQQPDGYTVLMAAEPQALFRVLNLAPFDFQEFTPINIVSINDSILLVANPKVPANTTQELFDYVKANPKKLKQYIAGQGTVPFTINAMINDVTPFETTLVPFDGDGPAIAALQGGHADIGFIASGAVLEHVKAGRLKALGVLRTEPFGDIPPMTEAPALAGLERHLPWGPFYGVFVRKETPDAVKAKLSDAFAKAAASPDYLKFNEDRGTRVLNLSGAEAQDFLDKWQSTTAWLYDSVGAAKTSPEALGIPKP